MTAVNETLKEINAQDKPMLIVFNKVDRIFEDEIIERLHRAYPDSVFISSLTGTGIEELKKAIAEFIESHLILKTFTIPSERQDLIGKLYQSGEVINRNDQDDKTKLKVRGYPAVLLRTKKEIDIELRRLKRKSS
jgi:GTP-binding protein HflX